MVVNTLTVIVIIGGIALLVGLLGGGIKIQEIVLPHLPSWLRALSIIIGLTFIAIGVYLDPSINRPATTNPVPTPTSIGVVYENNTLTPDPTLTLVPPPPTFTEEPPTYTPLPLSPTDTNTPLPTNTFTPTPVVAFVPRCGDQAWTVNFADNGTADVDYVFPQGYTHGFISSDPALVELPNGQSKQFSTQFVLIIEGTSSVKLKSVGTRHEGGNTVANTWGCIYGPSDAAVAAAEAKNDYKLKLDKKFLAELYKVDSRGFTPLESNVSGTPTSTSILQKRTGFINALLGHIIN